MGSRSVDYDKLKDSVYVSAATRRAMQGNRSAGTAPEEKLRKALWAAGLRGYRKNVKHLPGKPDVLYPKHRLCIQVRGCFWHSCPDCKRGDAIRKNTTYWQAKLKRNLQRDAEQAEALRTKGYRLLIVWEHELEELSTVVRRVADATRAG